MNRLKLALLLPLPLAITACVHLSQEQCQTTNWQQVGFNEGAAGNAPRTLAAEIEDCQKFHIAVDTEAYRRGWLAGVRQYCTPSAEQGKLDGSNGVPYTNILNRNSRCLSAGITLNQHHYKAGYNSGIQNYCTRDNGFTIGVQGSQPPEVCQGALKQRFLAGWEAGARQYCSNTQNAYAMGKEGKPYPAACPATVYYAFKAEYDRGAILRQKLGDVHGQLNSVNRTIDDLAGKWRLRKTFDARGYELGEDQSENARRALQEVKELMYRRDNLQSQLNQLEVTR